MWRDVPVPGAGGSAASGKRCACGWCRTLTLLCFSTFGKRTQRRALCLRHSRCLRHRLCLSLWHLRQPSGSYGTRLPICASPAIPLHDLCLCASACLSLLCLLACELSLCLGLAGVSAECSPPVCMIHLQRAALARLYELPVECGLWCCLIRVSDGLPMLTFRPGKFPERAFSVNIVQT